VAVILAAGSGRRMGGPKALLRFGGETFLTRAARLLARPGVASVVAVVGPAQVGLQGMVGGLVPGPVRVRDHDLQPRAEERQVVDAAVPDDHLHLPLGFGQDRDVVDTDVHHAARRDV